MYLEWSLLKGLLFTYIFLDDSQFLLINTIIVKQKIEELIY